MDLYTLDENFLRRDVVDNFQSIVWTERFTKAGDVNLVVTPSRENIVMLPEGTFLALEGSKEVMLIENALIEGGKLKLTGPSITQFLDTRVIRYSSNHADRYYNITLQPGLAMGFVVNDMVVAGSPYTTSSAYGVDGPRQVIPTLMVSDMDSSGAAVALAIPYGPLYTALQQIAETYQIGFQMYLESSSPAGYFLMFRTYAGKDRTSKQSVNDVVRLSPNVDSLTDLKELRSIAKYKNVAYAFAPSNPVAGVTQSGVAYADNEAATSMGFDRRTLLVFADDLTTDKVGGSAAVLLQILNQRAKDALANNNYVKTVDGEVVPQAQFKYGTDYGLGDIVELQSFSGILQNARVTEYIRTKDATGERAYPTISVID
jgi:Siphovirus ReqiPepy6 Gp37-like protein